LCVINYDDDDSIACRAVVEVCVVVFVFLLGYKLLLALYFTTYVSYV